MKNIANQLAQEFLEKNEDFVESDQFVPNARAVAHEIDSKSDRIVFLTHIMAHLTRALEKHGDCGNPRCTVASSHNKVLYFLKQELARLDVAVNRDPFTSSERDAIFEKLEAILNELAQMKDGQGIVAQDVEDLKDLIYLGKQKWKRQFAGTITEWVGAGMVSEAWAKPLLNEVGSAVDQMLTVMSIPH